MKYLLATMFLLNVILSGLRAEVLNVGQGFPFSTIVDAANVAQPGDSIVCHDVTMPGGMFIANLKGTANHYIYILASANAYTTIQGGSNAIQFSDCAYLNIQYFNFQGQTGNGLNIDDGGSFDTPTHHIILFSCIFQKINASGNNDLLKLSGLDDFVIKTCLFLDGATGGSGIDMVGCHRGLIEDCEFRKLGSNSIQAKGGTSHLNITRNVFENGGARALNLGGSTGLQFFRPQDAVTEAEDIDVIANVITGSEAAIAFVGCRRVKVSNNTIINPGKWVLRILQETVDEKRFLPCGENSFFNNIVVINNNVSTEVNIGPDTAPETFDFKNNLWYKTTNTSWQGPNLPGSVSAQIVKNPEIIPNSVYIIKITSPAVAAGISYPNPVVDILGETFNNPPSLGAYEARRLSTSVDKSSALGFDIYPNPFTENVNFKFEDKKERTILLYTMDGRLVQQIESSEKELNLDCTSQIAGLYVSIVKEEKKAYARMIVKR